MRIKRYLLASLSFILAFALAGCGVAAETVPSSAMPAISASAEAAGISAPVADAEPANDTAIAVGYVEGEVTFLHGGEETPLSKDVLLHEGDAVKTGSDGMAVLKLDGDKKVQIAPDSHVEIALFTRGEGGDNTRLMLHKGNVINILDAPLGDADSYEVETPALVMAVRGTIASVSSDPALGQDHVLIFEGHSVVRAKFAEDVVEIDAGEYAGGVNAHLESRAFTGEDLSQNERWFLTETDYTAVFGADGSDIPQRLQALPEDAIATSSANTVASGANTGNSSATTSATTSEATTSAGSGNASGGNRAAGAGNSGTAAPAAAPPPAPVETPAPAGNDAPPADNGAPAPNNNTPPAGDGAVPATQAPADPAPAPDNGGQGGGMDEATFRAIETEFHQAQQAHNSGLISLDEFLAVKQRFLDAKALYYGYGG